MPDGLHEIRRVDDAEYDGFSESGKRATDVKAPPGIPGYWVIFDGIKAVRAAIEDQTLQTREEAAVVMEWFDARLIVGMDPLTRGKFDELQKLVAILPEEKVTEAA